MSNAKTIQGYHGSNNRPTEVYVYECTRGFWYCAEGGTVVNLTMNNLELGVNIEEVQDLNCFTVNNPIGSEEDLINAVCN